MLPVAAAEGQFSVATKLVELGLSVTAKDRWGHDALSEARDHGHDNLAEVLYASRLEKLLAYWSRHAVAKGFRTWKAATRDDGDASE